MVPLNILKLKGFSIFSQLELEEALLRGTRENWCLINEGSSPAIVLGISGKPAAAVDLAKARSLSIPLIKRYSGGGTVVVDGDTLFISFIFRKDAHGFPLYPEEIFRWSGSFYRSALPIPKFQLREGDYAIGDRKCGGNAQYVQRERFVHHTAFLWDYDRERMDLLLPPLKAPAYRGNRSHHAFLCRLKEHLPSKRAVISSISRELASRYASKEVAPPSLDSCREHRRVTAFI